MSLTNSAIRIESKVKVCPFFPAAAAVFAIAKAIALSWSLPFFKALLHGVDIILGDLSFIGVFFVGMFLQGSKFPFLIRFCLHTFFGLLLFWYGLDTMLVMRLNYRVNVLDLFAFANEFDVLEEIRSAGYFLALYIGLIVYVQRFRVRVLRTRIAMIAIVLLVLSTLGLGQRSKYATNMALARKNFFGSWVSRFSPEQLTKLDAESPRFLPEKAPEHPVILLVIIESMSAVDSRRTSGLSDNFPRLDELSKKGRLFQNFIANYTVTEGGLVSLFMGNAPLVFPGYPLSFRTAFWNQDSIVRALEKFGYHSHFISSAPLGFREKGTLISKLGFKEVAGLDEVPRFAAAPRFTFGAVADGILYEEALVRLEEQSKRHEKLFFVVETTTTHLPYVDPLKRGDTEKNVLDYADTELAAFFAKLEQRKFFDRGLLIVTGDHHKPVPITQDERMKYGPSAEARIPLMIFGRGIPRGIDERLFQQADLFRYLSRIPEVGRELSNPAIFVEAYTAPLIGGNPSSFRVFTPNGGYYSQSILGKEYAWNGDAVPPNRKPVELDILRRLARLQYCYDNSPECSTGKRRRWFFPGMSD